MDQLAIKLYSLQPITSGLVIYKPIVTLIIVVPLKAYPEVQLNVNLWYILKLIV